MSISLASSLIGVVVTGTSSCDELLSNKGAGIVTSSSSTFLPLTSFERNSFSRETPSPERIHSQQRISCLRICDRRCTQHFFWVSYEDIFLRFGFELIRMKLFHISIATPNFKKRQLWFLAKPQFIWCRLNGFRWCPI